MVNPTDHMLYLLRSSKCYRLDIDITADGFKLFWHYFDNAVSTNSLKLMSLDTFLQCTIYLILDAGPWLARNTCPDVSVK